MEGMVLLMLSVVQTRAVAVAAVAVAAVAAVAAAVPAPRPHPAVRGGDGCKAVSEGGACALMTKIMGHVFVSSHKIGCTIRNHIKHCKNATVRARKDEFIYFLFFSHGKLEKHEILFRCFSFWSTFFQKDLRRSKVGKMLHKRKAEPRPNRARTMPEPCPNHARTMPEPPEPCPNHARTMPEPRPNHARTTPKSTLDN